VSPQTPIDPVSLEVIRHRLQSVTTEMSAAIVKTAVSPVISEARDFSCILYDGQGHVVASAATVPFHLGVSAHAVRTVRAELADIGPGDVFIVNDPHHGGGLHPQDVIVMRPVYLADRCMAWASASGHMIDMGGMTPGSFAPEARERYQEALMIPPVRLLRRGVEERDVWALVLNNVRLADKVEMDLRSLIAGVNVADAKIRALVAAYGESTFATAATTICQLSEDVLRRRIAELPRGRYRARGWAEFNEDAFEVVCTLTVADGGLEFDYRGSSPQCPYFFNSTEQIVASELIVRVHQILASDVPFTDGILRPVQVSAPRGSIVNSEPPAAVGAAHMHVGLLATELGETCLKRALACSRSPRRSRITAPGGTTGMGLSTWHGRSQHGVADTFLVMDGNAVGAGACMDRDGIDVTGSNYGGPGLVYPDVEIVEQAYPVLYLYKRLRTDSGGAGRHRGGASVDAAISAYGTDALTGTTLGMRRYVPTAGLFGGYPAATTLFEVKRGARIGLDGSRTGLPSAWERAPGRAEPIASNASNIVLAAGDAFRFTMASGGGLGDPLERSPEAVARDVVAGYVSAQAAAQTYGVILGKGRGADEVRTKQARRAMRMARLARVDGGPQPPQGVEGPVIGTLGLAVEIVERGGRRHARCARCRAFLATAPEGWRRGAARAERRIGAPDCAAGRNEPGGGGEGWLRRGPEVIMREFFCPRCATALEVEVAVAGAPLEDDAMPATYAGGSAAARAAGAEPAT
jgi:N-methylhydantoinase B